MRIALAFLLVIGLVSCGGTNPNTLTTPTAPTPPALKLANDLHAFTDSLAAVQNALETAKVNGAVTPATMATINAKFIVPSATLVKQIDAILRAQPDWPTAKKQIIGAVAAAGVANVSASVPATAQTVIAVSLAAYNTIAVEIGAPSI